MSSIQFHPHARARRTSECLADRGRLLGSLPKGTTDIPADSKQQPGFWLGSLETVVQSAERFAQNAIDEKVPGVVAPISVLVINNEWF
jgi:hypothetical protein